MPSEKTIKYGRPTPPTDPNAEYMTVQETASIFGCGVNTVRKLARQAGVGGIGRRIMLSKANRDTLWSKHAGPRRLTSPGGSRKSII
jgi:hypothetical protein